jgi:putative DNA primase/helicase
LLSAPPLDRYEKAGSAQPVSPSTNPLLHFTDASGVIASRFVPVLFQESFEGRENIKLSEELLEELPGILNLAMEGLRRLRERGYFGLPASSRAAIERTQLKAAPIFGFLDDCCDIGADHSIERDVLFQEYVAWAENNKHKPMTKTAFVAALEDADTAIKCERPRGPGGKRDYRFYGIRLNQKERTARSSRKATEDEMRR